ncbi:uncharacterized protein N7515_004945 [Penicillium bovifimosum]|uniref:Uncharacterized protein n=1 Tax=Penicillium bovifimosum TaxID=126998 RepID=A0A9W9H132_9EURO|nr:uncharacterized protein N7515_004945 [Penicillium bovifimosum]KAJ5135667.1 hypothetical protein N7515_004945 [Penicillium bovifimosum]
MPTKSSKTVAETSWDTGLHPEDQWGYWITQVESMATMLNVWHYMDPNLPEDQVCPAPVASRETYLHPSEINPEATNSLQLSKEDHELYRRIVSQFNGEWSWAEHVRSKINEVNNFIIANMFPEYRYILLDKTPYEKLVFLKQRFEPIVRRPKGATTYRIEDSPRQRVRNAWRDLVRRPIGKTSINKWLATWSKLYEEGKAMQIPEIAYKSDEYPQDRDAIYDFLHAVQPFDEIFAVLWREKIEDPNFAISFHDVLAAFRNHRNVKGAAKSQLASSAAWRPS